MEVFSEAVFNGKDLAMVVGWAVMLTVVFFKFRSKVEHLETTTTSKIEKMELVFYSKLDKMTSDNIIINQDLIHAKNSRASMRKQFEGEVEKIEKRIDSNDISIRSEFKEINSKLDEIIGYQKGQKDKK